MTYEAIRQSSEEFPVARQCAVLGVSESGYYAWRNRLPGQREQENTALKETIYTLWNASGRIYGAPRIHHALQHDEGMCIGHNRVARLMREMGITGKMPRRKRPRTTQSDPTHMPAPNILARNFVASRCHEVWLTDITYIDTDEGDLYLAGVMDLFSRQIVGMAVANHLRTELVETALDMALQQHQPDGKVIHHSDRGCQYTSQIYQNRLIAAGITSSMSRTANCLDNAPMESFWATLKRECADVVFTSHHHARTTIFGYIMGFYNRFRKHSALGYLSPVAFEQQQKRELLAPLI